MIYTSRLAVSPGCDNTNLAGVACQDSDAKDEVLGAPHLSHSCHMDSCSQPSFKKELRSQSRLVPNVRSF
ncbi:hypothetical protein POX_c03530 [Penicillium oxalicum]|uniref:Uncharacterized protein n=1 Tax=Penicillium oxalicum (strain 114-2 / CGMCC 5302) TaxID=933388 RepID=S7Z8X9_PENO1|nr:hypothetical protein POX_c03530 [Penicillium oxalicum]EPS25126.1 hypothetical protein PDE_00057 [Penicillium oxalicum 114-2]KAI2790684.1 hypothetical protein POX_c03530 [Penicillium oxalicum]